MDEVRIFAEALAEQSQVVGQSSLLWGGRATAEGQLQEQRIKH